MKYDGIAFSRGARIKDKHVQREYYVKQMLCRTQKIFKYEGLPDTIPKVELEKLLQENGFAIIAKINGEIYAFGGGLGGEPDVYYRPTIATVANPALSKENPNYEHQLKIGVDCVVIKNDSYRMGLLPIFNKYCAMMSENDISMNNTSILARIQALLLAGDNKAKKEAEVYLASVLKGDLAFLNSNSFSENIQVAPYAIQASNQLTNLIEYHQYLKASMLNEIGLNANWNAKRESLNSNESQLNGDFLLPLVDDMLENRENGIEQMNEMFGLNVSVKFTSSWEDIQARESIEAELDEETDEAEAAGLESEETSEEAPEEKAEDQSEEAEDQSEAEEKKDDDEEEKEDEKD